MVRTLILSLIALELACSSMRGASPTPGASTPPMSAPRQKTALRGRVTLPNGQVPGQAFVALIAPASAGTFPALITRVAPDGSYSFEDVRPGAYGVTVTSRDAGAAYGGSVLIGDGAPRELPLVLDQRYFAVHGRVSDATGPISGAWIKAARVGGSEGDVFVTWTDAEGHYELRLPLARGYRLIVEAAGYALDTERIEAAAQRRDVVLDASTSSRPATDEVRRWLTSAAFPLTSLTPAAPLDDLRPLKAMVGDASIVGLGEATHNSAEFFSLRHRLFEYLATELGFDVFVMEVNWPEADRVNEYVTRGAGDPEQLLAGLRFWTSDTLEMLELIRWMRRYNEDPKHARKLRFRGVDLQYTGLSSRAVQSYVARVDPAFAPQLVGGLRELGADDAIGNYSSLPQPRQQAVREFLSEAEARFEAKRAEYEARSSPEDFALARQHLRLLEQAQADYTDPSTRDASMAANFAWVVEREAAGSKFVLWAHNGHVSFERGGAPALGALLRERWGRGYFALGTFFLRGSFRAWDWTQGQTTARGVREFAVGTAPPDTFEAALAVVSPPFLLDLRSAPAAIARWLGEAQQTRTLGSAFRSERAMRELFTPAKSYDALVLLDRVTAAHPTRTGVREPKQ